MKWGIYIKNISKYFKQLNDTGRNIKIFTYATLLWIMIFCLDIMDKPSAFFTSISLKIRYILGIGAIVLLVNFAFYKRVYRNFKIVSVNYIDSMSIIGLLIGSISALIWSLIEGYCYKTIGALSVFVISLISLIIRIATFYKTTKEFDRISSGKVLYDLNSIYNNNFGVENGNPILISEKDVDYDLLGRKGIIDQLYKYVSSYKADTSFVIGLVGVWGSGKTTIINNVKNNLEVNSKMVYIDDFDPWIFGTQEALLYEMFDKILQKTDIKFSLSKSKNLMKSLKNVMSKSNTDITFLGNLIEKITPTKDTDVSYLTQEISNYLILNDKTVVFFIDNIDRAESENIIFMFKLIGTVFNLPNVVYVLSYDKKRVNDILQNTTKINPKYMEKIIQQEIYVPKIQYERLREIYKTCIINILNKYNITSDEINDYLPIIDFICETVDNLRNFKRLINSVFSNVFLYSCKLDKAVLLAIETIHFLDFDLYESILENGRYYISSDTIYNQEPYIQHRTDDFDKNGKSYFEDTFKNRSAYKNILSIIFPYVYQYANNRKLSDVRNYENPKLIQQKAPIFSLKFFELYFSYGTNEFLEERNEVKQLIDLLNQSDSITDIKNTINEVIVTASSETQKEKLEIFQLHLNEIPVYKLFSVIDLLWENIDKLDDTPQFLSLSAKSRAIVVITMLLIKIPEKDIYKFITIKH